MTQRIIWIDLAKAFGIFLVVVGHVTGFAHNFVDVFKNFCSTWFFLYGKVVDYFYTSHLVT